MSRVPCPSSFRSPLEENPYISELEEKVLDLLEQADVPQDICDKIIELVREAEGRE